VAAGFVCQARWCRNAQASDRGCGGAM